jgi:hypothetical protein
MKKYLYSLAILFALPFLLQAQSVPRKAVAEHFTNSWCSICAGVNPTLYATLRNNPNVLHISYFPSSPYSGCQINRFNTAGNDTRTRYYDAYGSTPKVVLQGSTLISGGSFSSVSLFNSIQNQTSAIGLKVVTSGSGTDSVRVRVVITKVGDLSETSLQLYGIITTDTLQFNAQNGERTHYNVFRTALNGNSGTTIQVPSAIGDSLVLNYRMATDVNWGRVSATFLLQTTNRAIVQAERASIGRNVISSISNKYSNAKWFAYNAQEMKITSVGNTASTLIVITDLTGREVMRSILTGNNPISLAKLPKGIYQAIAPELKQNKKIVVQ